MMKKLTYIAAMLLTAWSCSLEEDNDRFISSDKFYENQVQCESAVKACYNPLYDIYKANFMIAVEGCTDLFYTKSTTMDACLDVTPSKPQFGSKVWNAAYKGIMYCNECIACIPGSEATPDDVKAELLAEVKVIRALYYYILTNFFNGVPFYTCRVDSIEKLDEIQRLPRTDADQIRRTLYNELKDNVIGTLPAIRGSEVKEARAGSALALMLMAKFALWTKDYDDALFALERIEEIYGEFNEEAYPLEKTMWRYENTPESIFEIQHEYSLTGTQRAGDIACIMTPPHYGDGIFDGIYMAGYGTTMPKWSSLRTNNSFALFRPTQGHSQDEISKSKNCIFAPVPLTWDFRDYDDTLGRYRVKLDLEAYKSGEIRSKTIDRRFWINLSCGNLETGDTFTESSKNGRCWPEPKFWCPDIVKGYDSNNYKIFRYADAILMIAECHLAQGDLALAAQYVNKIRARAGVSSVSASSSEDAMWEMLRNERARELCGEFHRKFDLVRWGLWYELTLGNSNNDNLKDKIRPCHRYYPIPDKQCALSGHVLTNDEYKNEGL